jgi:hypothetical protein
MPTTTRARAEAAFPVGMVVYAAWLAARPIDEADNFFHLTLGRAVLQFGARTFPEPTAFVDFTDRAVASEWLWSVLSYVLYRAGGFVALSLLGVLLAAAATWGVTLLVRRYADDAVPFAHRVFLCALVFSILQSRVAVRPQLVLLAGLPPYLLATRAYASVPMPRRAAAGVCLALAVVVWAQLHGSFVLAPLIFLIQIARPPSALSRAELRADAFTLLLLLAALLSSAYGSDLSHFIGSHAAGDAPRFVAEMARPTWSMFDPTSAPSMLAFWLLLFLGAAGMLIARRLFVRETSLLLLGIALLATANRFIAEAALLATPWAARSIGALSLHLQSGAAGARTRISRVVPLLAAGWLLAATGLFVQVNKGPLLRLGVLASAFALHAPSVLGTLPAGSAVLTDYAASAPLGFLTHGRLRSFVDGRTPLYFDDTDFAVQREMMRDGAALRLGIARYGAHAAVVHRESEACVQLAQSWSVALVEPLFTTFVERPNRLMPTALRGCGVRYVGPDACQDSELDSSLAFERAHGDGAFARFLGAERVARCGGDAPQALAALSEIAPFARPYATAFERTRIELSMRARHFDAASEGMIAAIRGGDRAMVSLLQSPSAGELPLELARRVLEAYLDVARDDADPATRAALAEICSRVADPACVRFNATRAAVRGRDSNALHWLAAHHPEARVRRDAARWLDVLAAQRSASPVP